MIGLLQSKIQVIIVLYLFSSLPGTAQEATLSYSQSKILVNKKRLHLKKEDFETNSKLFSDLLLNKIFPYWYGTKWSFEGYTEIPKKGTIACGYFVSTTLRDLGVKVNRYKLAQLSPSQAANVLSLGNSVMEVKGDNAIENYKTINSKIGNGVYFIGYDAMHVGFLLKENQQLFLIHSNYFGLSQVEKENIENSKVFSICKKFYIVPLSNNKELIQNWITNKVIKINQ